MTNKEQHFVYVMAAADKTKVGFSVSPEGRRRALQGSKNGRVTLYAVLPVSDHRAVEAAAHMILDGHKLGGEWFSISPEEALIAVRTASLMVDFGWTTPKAGPMNSVMLTFMLPVDLIDQIHQWRATQPGIPPFRTAVRRLVSEALALEGLP